MRRGPFADAPGSAWVSTAAGACKAPRSREARRPMTQGGDATWPGSTTISFRCRPSPIWQGCGSRRSPRATARRSATSRCSSCGSSPRPGRRRSRTGTRRGRRTGSPTSPASRGARGCRSTCSRVTCRRTRCRPRPRSSRRSRPAGGDVGGLVHAFLRAVWAEDRDIAEDEVVRDILAGRGLRSGARRPRDADGGRDPRAQHRRGAAPRRSSARRAMSSATRSSGARTACRISTPIWPRSARAMCNR